MSSPFVTPLVLLAPMEGLLDFVLRDILTRVGGIDRCVSEFIRITDQLLPEKVFTRVMPELRNGSRTRAGTIGSPTPGISITRAATRTNTRPAA